MFVDLSLVWLMLISMVVILMIAFPALLHHSSPERVLKDEINLSNVVSFTNSFLSKNQLYLFSKDVFL